MIDYQLNTRLNGNLAMTFCFHENKALQQDTTLYKFIWVRSGNLTLEIDHIPIQLEQDEIISLTPLQHIEIKSVEGEYLTFLFNSNFYCIFGHDDEVSCNGFLFHGSSQVMKLKLSPEQSANLNDIIRIFRQESAVRDNLQEEMLRIILKRFIITCTRIAREKCGVTPEQEKAFDIVEGTEKVPHRGDALKLIGTYQVESFDMCRFFRNFIGINHTDMLPTQQTIQFSSYTELYDLIIPPDNLLRRINDLIDFSFIQKELMDKYCPDNGRTAESPIMMFKYLLLKTIYDISDVDVVERSRYDMSFKYFLGMTPENTDLINPSSLCKFRKLRLKDKEVLDLLIGKTVNIAIEKGIIKSRTLIVDATHTGSRSNPYSPIEILRLRSKQLRKSLYDSDDSIKDSLPSKNTDDNLEHELAYTKGLLEVVSSTPALVEVPKIKERLNMLKEVLSDIEDHYVTSKDEDARIGHKSEDDSFFGYKTHIAMSDERIITAATVTSGEKGDGPQLQELVEQSRANGMTVDTVVGDTAYSGKDNITLSNNEENGFALVARLNPTISNGARKDEDKFDYNKDAGMFVCPAGHMAVRRARQGKKGQATNQTMVYYFDIQKCKTCSRRNGCYKEGAKCKTYSVQIKSEQHQQQANFEKTDEFKEKAGVRYKIEAKNAELKNVLGYDRALSYGIECMRMQGAMVIFVANIKRILKLS